MDINKIEILLVEDNPYEAKLTIHSLKQHNLTEFLHHVEDGAEALDFMFAQGAYTARQGQCMPKVILLDLNLPKIGGLDVLRQIRANEFTKHVPIVLLTSSKQDSDIKTGYALGANSYIVKPVEFDSFSKAIGDLGLYWSILNQPVAA